MRDMNQLNHTANLKLTDAAAGSVVKVESINGGDKFRDKLLSMGILPGKSIEVMSLSRKGPVIIKISDTRIVIGHGMASKITVTSMN